MTVVRAVVWMVALALGVGIGLSTYVISNETRAPAKALAAGAPVSGVAIGNMALASLATRRVRNPEARVNSLELRLAGQAYRAEPLAASAVALQALAMTRKEEVGRGASLLELAGKLTRRSLLVNSSLIDTAARSGDEQKFFVWISRTMLTNSDAGQVYGKAMAIATARDGAVEALVDILGPKPSWSDLYWQLVIGQPGSLANAAKLRAALVRKPWNQTAIEPTDRALVLALSNAGKFDEARQLAQALQPAKGAQKSPASDGRFYADRSLAPFDWELSTLGNLGASIDNDSRQLTVSAIGGANGSAARQLVSLSPDEYRLGWSVSSSAPLPANAVSVRIICAEPDSSSAVAFTTELVSGKREKIIRVPNSDCRWYWLSIDVALPDDAMGVDVVLSRLSLAPVS